MRRRSARDAAGRSTPTSYDPATGRTRTTRGAAEVPTRRQSEGTAHDGRAFWYDLRERVLAQDVLPDTPAARRQLRLGRPTG